MPSVIPRVDMIICHMLFFPKQYYYALKQTGDEKIVNCWRYYLDIYSYRTKINNS